MSSWRPFRVIGRLTRTEVIVAGVVAVVMLGLVLLEPDILGAPFENANTIVFTAGGTIVAAIALVLMLRFAVPPAVRVVVLLVPFAIVNWWLLSPFFLDDVVDEDFATSISDQLGQTGEPAATTTPDDAGGDQPNDGPTTDGPTTDGPTTDGPTTDDPVVEEPTGPVLLGAGSFVGLAGHSGTGDAGLFQNADGSYSLRFENFDIENGPDLVVYLVPGADQTSLGAGSIDLGSLKGNVGNQTYDLPADIELPPGSYTALVWCDAFSVEFVGATLSIA